MAKAVTRMEVSCMVKPRQRLRVEATRACSYRYREKRDKFEAQLPLALLRLLRVSYRKQRTTYVRHDGAAWGRAVQELKRLTCLWSHGRWAFEPTVGRIYLTIPCDLGIGKS